MTSRKVIALLLLIPVFLIGVMLGCSDKTFTSTTAAINENASPTAFIPLEQGLRVSYVILEPETEYFDVEVTDPVNVAGHPGYTIRKTNRNTGEIDYSYRYQKGNAIFESGSTNTPGERILESPFVAGNNWDRFDTTTSPPVIIGGGNGDDDEEVGKDGDIIPGGSNKNNPDGSYSSMLIVAVESVETTGGKSYGNCLKVAWQTDESTYNYYWYAAGIGLVKFEYNYNSLAASDNRTIGVMTDFQTVQY
jgi:hypothetical protein